jgi:hypothetical protein
LISRCCSSSLGGLVRRLRREQLEGETTLFV